MPLKARQTVLLGIGLPLTIALGALMAAALFGEFTPAEAVILAIVLLAVRRELISPAWRQVAPVGRYTRRPTARPSEQLSHTEAAPAAPIRVRGAAHHA